MSILHHLNTNTDGYNTHRKSQQDIPERGTSTRQCFIGNQEWNVWPAGPKRRWEIKFDAHARYASGSGFGNNNARRY